MLNFRELRISTLLATLCFIWIPIYIGAYVFFGDGSSSNHWTALLASLLAGLTGTLVIRSNETPYFDSIAVLSIVQIMHFFPRLFQYIAVSKGSRENMYILFPIEWSAEQINSGIVYITLGTLVTAAGLWASSFIASRGSFSNPRALPTEKNIPTILSLLVTGLVIYSVEAYFSLYQGLSASANCFPDVRAKWLTHFFSADIYTMALIFLLIAQGSSMARRQVVTIAALIALYLLFTLALGSRSGIIRILILFTCGALATYGNFKLPTLRMAKFAPIGIVIAIALFPLGTAIRAIKTSACDSSTATAVIAPSPEVSGPSQPRNSFYTAYLDARDARNDNKLRPPQKINDVFDRLGVLDYPIGIMAAKADSDAWNHYFSFAYLWRTIINNVVPGTPFPKEEIMTARIHPILFRQRDQQHIETTYLSELYTAWGLAFLFGGYWGGLFLMFLGSFICGVAYLWGSRVISQNRVVFKGLYLWGFLIGSFYLTQGIDYSIVIMSFFAIQTVVTLTLFSIFSQITRGRVPTLR